MRHRVIQNTTNDDLEFIFGLFDRSVEYQEKKGFPVWRSYDKDALKRDVENKNQYKIITESQIGIVFSVGYSDKFIWGELENGDSVYLHRIVVNPECKGQRLFGVILEWTIQHARSKGLDYVRMDTWADNPTLMNYYTSFGFSFTGNCFAPNVEDLPTHDRNLELALLQLEVNKVVV